MQGLRWAGFAFGIVFIAVTGLSLVVSLIVPRRLASRPSRMVERLVRRGFLFMANRLKSYEAKDRVLAFEAPTALLVVMVTWLFLFLVGYGLMLWPFTGHFWEAMRESGSSLLTLGFAAHATPEATVIGFMAATTGLVVVALLIAYLPALYSAFNRRETLVTVLQSRAGAPAWGTEILIRHKTVDLLGSLPAFYRDWELWAADVAESHANYSILVRFRSPHPLRSWILGLLAVMDSAALYLALSPQRAPAEARLCLRMGFYCLRDVAEAIGLPFDPDPFPDDPIELTYEEFLGAVRKLEEADFPIEVPAEEAWPHFCGWRVNYEAIAYSIANWVVAPPGPWSGERDHLPGMAILPQSPVNRRPGDRNPGNEPKVDNPRWRA